MQRIYFQCRFKGCQVQYETCLDLGTTSSKMRYQWWHWESSTGDSSYLDSEGYLTHVELLKIHDKETTKNSKRKENILEEEAFRS